MKRQSQRRDFSQIPANVFYFIVEAADLKTELKKHIAPLSFHKTCHQICKVERTKKHLEWISATSLKHKLELKKMMAQSKNFNKQKSAILTEDSKSVVNSPFFAFLKLKIIF